jgi:hypothetical protein
MFVELKDDLYWVCDVLDLLEVKQPQAIAKKRKLSSTARIAVNNYEKIYVVVDCASINAKAAVKASDCTDVDIDLKNFYDAFSTIIEKDFAESDDYEALWYINYQNKRYCIRYIDNVTKTGFTAVVGVKDEYTLTFDFDKIEHEKLKYSENK